MRAPTVAASAAITAKASPPISRRLLSPQAFHFAFIEAGGTSLYPTLAQKVTNLEVLRILLSIGPSETMHFQTWQDKAGNALPITDTDTGFPGSTGATVSFADLTKAQGETNPESLQGDTLQANLIMPARALPFPGPRFGSGGHHSSDLNQAQRRGGGYTGLHG